ncbi:hypothetical protein V6U90_13085 [Micromonospora sp. CPCC 206060]|uniref:hypothetical protein n=1 Tax=Micromonospora sp. CPCC 206060 TaxID=3122406 RepID=UPI002FF31D39
MRIPYARGSFLRSPLAVGVLLALVIATQGVAQAALNAEEWIGNWRTTSSSLRYASLWGACVTAAAAAWAVATPRRNRYAPMLTTASRSAWRVYGAALTAVVGGSLLGYVVVAAYVIWTTQRSATHGTINVLDMLPAAGWTMAGAGIGVVAGRFLPAVVAPVAAATAPYLLPAVGMSVDLSTGRVFFGDLFGLDDSARDYLRPPTELLVSKTALWVLLGVAAVAWVLRSNRLAYALVLAAGFAAAGAFLVAGARYDVPEEYAIKCLGDSPRVCTDRAHDHLLPQYHRLVRQGLGHIDGLSLTGRTVVHSSSLFPNAQRFTETAADPGPGQLIIEITKGYTSPAHEIDPRAFVARLGTGLFFTPCLTAPPQNAASLDDARIRSMMLYGWWLRHHNLPTDGSNYTGEININYATAENAALATRTQAFTAMSDADRAAWFRRNGPTVLTCGDGADR